MTALAENDPLPTLYDGLGRQVQEITVDHNLNLASNDLYYSTSQQILEERLNVVGEGAGDGGILNVRNVWSIVYVNALVQQTGIAYWDPTYISLNVTQDANYNVTTVLALDAILPSFHIHSVLEATGEKWLKKRSSSLQLPIALNGRDFLLTLTT